MLTPVPSRYHSFFDSTKSGQPVRFLWKRVLFELNFRLAERQTPAFASPTRFCVRARLQLPRYQLAFYVLRGKKRCEKPQISTAPSITGEPLIGRSNHDPSVTRAIDVCSPVAGRCVWGASSAGSVPQVSNDVLVLRHFGLSLGAAIPRLAPIAVGRCPRARSGSRRWDGTKPASLSAPSARHRHRPQSRHAPNRPKESPNSRVRHQPALPKRHPTARSALEPLRLVHCHVPVLCLARIVAAVGTSRNDPSSQAGRSIQDSGDHLLARLASAMASETAGSLGPESLRSPIRSPHTRSVTTERRG